MGWFEGRIAPDSFHHPNRKPFRRILETKGPLKTMKKMTLWGIFCALLVTVQAMAAPTITFDSLLDEMIDRGQLAQTPEPFYTCSQASSYDRGTVAPDQPGWFANMDRSYFVRKEPKGDSTEYVLMDEEGPGVVVRMWATWHGPGGKNFSNGTLRFYLDGQSTPAIEGPITEIIDGGGLVTGPLAEGVSPLTPYGQRGHNLYLPIPYAKHCKVTYETDVPVDDGAYKGEALYYQINYRTYAEGTSVESFAMQQIEKAADKIEQVQERLLASGIGERRRGRPVQFDGTIDPGARMSVEIERPGAIRMLTMNVKAENLPQALRSTVLSIKFDGNQAVWVPVGAFFGRGYMSAPHRTWYTEVLENGQMSTYWVMPFQEGCVIELINLSEQPVEITDGAAVVGRWRWDDRSMYFHGSWHQLTEISSFKEGADNPGEGAFDVNYVTVEGEGVYVGDTLTVFNGAGAWWGEGDEKVFVDGEKFPSHVGTGTEDYYGYAWCRPEFFSSPFHAQPSGAGNITPGFTVNSRYRALDAIPFKRSLQFDMELWHWQKTTVNYAPAAFWYARPGSSSSIEPDPETAAKEVPLKRTDIVEVFRLEGAIEGEDLKVIEFTGGTVEPQGGAQFRWSNEEQVWWKFGETGDRLVLEFPVETAGKYDVIASLTKAVDYGIVSISIDGGDPVEFDRYHTSVANDELSLGEHDLTAGMHKLTVTVTGSNPNAVKSYMFGLDYLRLAAP
jgi:hypothetical protein